MLTYVCVLLLASLAAGQLPDFAKHESMMNSLTSRLVGMSNKLNAVTSSRVDSAGTINSLQWAMDKKLGSFCGPRKYNCRNSVQCVAVSTVCDKTRDCNNGSDEDDCDVPFAVGDTFNVMFSTAGSCLTDLQNVRLTITSFTNNAWFPGRAQVGYMVNADQSNAIQTSTRMSVAMGSYFYGTKQLMLEGTDSGTKDTADFNAGGNGRFAIMSYRLGNNEQCNRGVGAKA